MIEEAMEETPIPKASMERQCRGEGCKVCSNCFRCRTYGCCFGGKFQSWGCALCSKCTKCRSALLDEDWKIAEVHLARRGSTPAWITGLQTPPRKKDADPLTCMFCKDFFLNPTKTGAHERACLHMPFDMWIARTRHCSEIQSDRTCPCKHCGTLFQSIRGAVQHASNCEQRRRIAKLPLDTKRWHNTSKDAAQL